MFVPLIVVVGDDLLTYRYSHRLPLKITLIPGVRFIFRVKLISKKRVIKVNNNFGEYAGCGYSNCLAVLLELDSAITFTI